MKLALWIVAGTVAALALGAYVVVQMNEPVGDELPAIPSASETPAPRPTPTPSDDHGPTASCSAASFASTGDETSQELPPAVAEMRAAIITAAVGCDFDALERLALAGGPGFSYSFGVEKSPARFWRAREREARNLDLATSEYMRYLVEILRLPHCIESQDDGTGTATEATYYVWPRVHCAARTEADWDDIEGLYPDEQIEEMRAGDFYYGFRVGILEDGDWVYFIAGD